MTGTFDFAARTQVVHGPGRLAEIGSLAATLGAQRAMVVSEHGVVTAGHAARAIRSLEQAEVSALLHSDFAANPDTAMAEQGRQVAAAGNIDFIIGLGGGSSMDLAKAINFVLTNGGTMSDYWGYGKAARPLLPMIGVPTTTGTGSEAQSYALISDAKTHRKMACGAPSAAFRIAILDPELCLSQPFDVRATSGFDAISHAVETWVTRKRTQFSTFLTREAWLLLSANYERVLTSPDDLEAIAAMQWGAYLAGWAIEQSMLGAAHACANPLTQTYGTVHGRALAGLLPAVVEWNNDPRYADLDQFDTNRLRNWVRWSKLPATLRDMGVREADLPDLAARAAEQWTATYNPRPLDAAGALEVYRCAW